MSRMNFYKLCYGLFLICELAVLYCNCQSATLTPVDPEVIEGNDITLVCTVSGTVGYAYWKLDVNAVTKFYIATYVRNEACRIVFTSYILDTTKYSFECNSTVQQMTVKNVQRIEHNDIYSCISEGQTTIATSTIKVQVPVSSVSIMPTQSPRDVIENAVVPFTCQASAARPDALVTWHMVESSVTAHINRSITSSTTDDDFSVTTSILIFVPSRQHNGVKIFCKATNAANTSPKQSSRITLNVLFRPGPPTDLRYRHDLTTTDSIHITWKPGHNGGLPQTFHIRYKESSTDTWSVININDTGDKIINYTITGLTEKTQYDIIIYASNRKGSSAESTVLKAFTKENEDNSTNNIAAVIGYSVGATSGCIILVLISIYLVLRFRTKRAASGNQADSSRNDGTKTEGPAVEANDDYDSISDVQEPNEISTGDAVYDNEESVSKYETLEMENRDVSNYSVLVDSTSDRTCREKIVYENMKLQ